ncbi:MAG: hypothetical protein AB8D52_06800 [Gammaproteobacteria bacterium]
MNKFLIIAVVSTSIFISACSTHVQTTSGQSYLEKYDQTLDDYAKSPKAKNNENTKSSHSRSIDQLVRQTAVVEPTLVFPARIGVARIDHGRLTTIPAIEIEAWEQSRKQLGEEFGEFVPVNPMTANMVASSKTYQDSYGYDKHVRDVISVIRLGAARQHLDAVLIYEVYSRENSNSNYLSIANLTILGAYILPSKAVTTEGYANAMLIDVIQGYPYGTVDAALDKSEMTSTFGVSQKRRVLSDEIKAEVTIKLVEEVEEMFKDLQLQLLRKRVEKVQESKAS